MIRNFFFLMLLIVPFTQLTHAQNSCEDPFAETGRLRFNPDFWERTDFCQTSISFDEVLSGGVPPNGIPSIDAPVYESIAQASEWLVEQSPVIAVTVNGESRAYPLAILTWHEIVNTALGDTPISVTFCPLCNSALVFERTLDGQVLDFGVSGNLRNSDLIMYDRQTESWWQQFTGEGIVGTFNGQQLVILPSQVVGFGQFAAQFPEGEVLSRQTGLSRNYGRNPYSGYDSSARPFLFDGELDPRLAPTARVLAGIVGGEGIAYPLETLQTLGVINDNVGGRDVVALWQAGVASALDREQIDSSRDIGTAALYSRTLADGRTLTFERTPDGAIIDLETRSTWNVFGLATDGDLVGTQLRMWVAGVHFWFAWAAFQPDATLYGAE